MKIKKLSLCLFLCSLFLSGSVCFADEFLTTLLAGYFRNNLSLQKLATDVELELLSAKSTNISNGFNIQLSSGTVTFKSGSDSLLTFTPNATLTFSQFNNLSFTASSEIDITSESKTVSDTSLSLSLDIYSGSSAKRKVALLESERSVLEAQRALQNGFLSAEKEFYTSLKSLFNTAVSIVQAEEELYEDKISFEEIKAQGYSTGSTKYRSAQMEVLSDERTVENSRRELEREAKIFASKCGIEYNFSDAQDFLPKEIPLVDAIDVLDFSKDDYTEIESARWTKFINTLSREAEKAFTLTGNLGYTFDNEDTDTDTVDAGAAFTLFDSALTLNAGVSLPVATNVTSPVYTFGFSVDPSSFFQYSITQNQNKLYEEQEEIALKSAQNDYDTDVITQQSSLEDILWSKQTNTDSYEMYSQLEEDTAEYFARGIITESEWLSAKVNKENYRIQCLINDIELIIYNNETELLFCRDSELKIENLEE